MFWLLKKIFGVVVLAAICFLALQFQVGGRTVKDYVIDFYQAPIVQEAVRQGKGILAQYLEKDIASPPATRKPDHPAMDSLSDEDRGELEDVLKKAR